MTKTHTRKHHIQESPEVSPLAYLNVLADVFSGIRGPNLGLRLHLFPYFVSASSEGAGESVHLRITYSIAYNNKCDEINIIYLL